MDELKKVIEDLGAAFAEYKKTNDARLEELKKGGQAGELEGKLSKIEGKMQALEEAKSALEAKLNRPGNPGAGEDPDQKEYRAAFGEWARKGTGEGALKTKSVNVGEGAAGGYAVPETINMSVYNLLRGSVSMRGVCSQIPVGSDEYSQLIGTHGATGGWVGEGDARGATNTPGLALVSAYMGEVYANPQASQKSLDDMSFNVEAWLSDEVSQEFAYMENTAFTTGDGVKKPKGLLAFPTSAQNDSLRPFGTIQFVKTGASGAFGTYAGDNLIDLMTALKTGHMAGASFMMNRGALATLRKVKDSQNNYLWQPGLQLGVPGALLGYGVTLNDDMPDIAANSLSIAFGSFAAAYVIVDRMGIRMLRDPYSNKPFVGFYTTKRVGSMLRDSEAVKFLKFAA